MLFWYTCDLLEVSLSDRLAVSVERSSELYRELAYIEVSVHYAALLEIEGILHEYGAFNLSPKVDVLADDIALDMGALPYYNATFAGHLALESTVDTDIAWRHDLTLDQGTCRNPADRICVNYWFHLCHSLIVYVLIFFYLCLLSVAVLVFLA